MQGKAIHGKVSLWGLCGRSYKTARGGCPREAAGHGQLLAGASQEAVLTKPSSVQKLVLPRPPRRWEPGPGKQCKLREPPESTAEAENKPSHPAVSLRRPLPTGRNIAPAGQKGGFGAEMQ